MSFNYNNLKLKLFWKYYNITKNKLDSSWGEEKPNLGITTLQINSIAYILLFDGFSS